MDTVWISRVIVLHSSYQESGVKNIGVFKNFLNAVKASEKHVHDNYQKGYYEVDTYCSERWELRK